MAAVGREQPGDRHSVLQRVLRPHTASSALLSAERKTEESGTEAGGCLSPFSLLLSLFLCKELLWLVLLVYDPRKEERDGTYI